MVMQDMWGKDSNIIAVTPFVLESNGGPFDKFTFYNGDDLTLYGKAYQNIEKQKGNPTLNKRKKIENLVKKNDESRKFKIFNQTLSDLTSVLLKSYFKAVFAVGK